MDVDIDFINREDILKHIQSIPAAILRNGNLVKHNTGIYAQNIPYNPLTSTANLDHHTAEERGYFKIDLLNVSAYDGVNNEQHLVKLMNTEPLWELLEIKEMCDQLFHVNGHHDLMLRLKPKSIEQLAMSLALIRPGKKHLTESVIKYGWDSIKNDIWKKTINGEYYWKKSHAISYAMLVVVQLNSLCEQAAA